MLVLDQGNGRVSPELRVLVVQLLGSLLSSCNELVEESFVVWVSIQVVLSQFKLAQNICCFVVLRHSPKLESLDVRLFCVRFQQWLHNTLVIQLSPNFLSLFPVLHVQSLAKLIPFLVHSVYF